MILALAPGLVAAPAEAPQVRIPIECGPSVCVIPREAARFLLEGFNAKADRIHELEGRVRMLESGRCGARGA